MQRHLGDTYAESWARDQYLPELGSRTVTQALDAGVPPKQVWAAVCDTLRLDVRER
jgi:hypothetical protein